MCQRQKGFHRKSKHLMLISTICSKLRIELYKTNNPDVFPSPHNSPLSPLNKYFDIKKRRQKYILLGSGTKSRKHCRVSQKSQKITVNNNYFILLEPSLHWVLKQSQIASIIRLNSTEYISVQLLCEWTQGYTYSNYYSSRFFILWAMTPFTVMSISFSKVPPLSSVATSISELQNTDLRQDQSTR